LSLPQGMVLFFCLDNMPIEQEVESNLETLVIHRKGRPGY
jgi:hypothetical protein